MKKLFILILFLSGYFISKAQDTRTDIAVVDSTTKIANYFGGSKVMYVKDNNNGGWFFLYQGALSVDGVNIFAGANSSKWRRLKPPVAPGTGFSLVHQPTGGIKRLNIGGFGGFLKADSTTSANSITIDLDSVRLALYNTNHPIGIKLEATGPLKASLTGDSLLHIQDSAFNVKTMRIAGGILYMTIRGVETAVGSVGGGGSGVYTVATAPNTANYTITTVTYLQLANLTGQANRVLTLPAAPVTGQTYIIKNLNPASSGFNWTFAGGVVKDWGGNTIITIDNLTTYELVYDGTNYNINN